MSVSGAPAAPGDPGGGPDAWRRALDRISPPRARLSATWRSLLARLTEAIREAPRADPAPHLQEDGGGREGQVPIPGAAIRRLALELGRHLEEVPAPDQALLDATRWVAEAIGLPVAIVVAEGEIVEEVLEWPEDGALTAHLTPLVAGGPDQGSVLATVLEDKRSIHVPVVGAGLSLFDGSDGAERLRSLAAVPLLATGETVGVMIVHSPVPSAVGPGVVVALEDLSTTLGLLVTNARLRQVVSAMQSAQEDARLREELLAALSHDMQTPLAVLLGSVKALQQFDDLAPKHRAGLYEGMARRGAQLQRLVEQFLDYSRLEAGRPIEARPSSTDVGAAIARLEADLGWRRPLQLAVPPDLPPAFVDPDRLNQVLANLVSNALKFSPVGSPISVSARAEDDVVQVVVEDRGRGMDPDELEAAFLKFHRGSGSGDTPGTGLGLYVSRAVIEAQGGQLTADSQLGRGSRFTLVLPRRPPGE